LPYNEKEEEEKRRKFEAEMRRKYHRPAIGKLYKPAHWKLDRKKTTHAVGLAIILLVLLLLWFGPSEVFQDVVDFEGKFAMILLKWKR
jgi:hypothetical protein